MVNIIIVECLVLGSILFKDSQTPLPPSLTLVRDFFCFKTHVLEDSDQHIQKNVLSQKFKI